MSRRLPPPRWQTPLPDGVAGSYGPIVGEYVRRVLGFEYDRWQQLALNRALVHDEAGLLLHRLYLISTARQNGKTATVRGVVGSALTERDMPDWSRILGLAHDKKQAQIPYRAVAADLAPMARRVGPLSRGGLAITRYLGIRSAMFGRPREYHVASREARDAVRGDSNDLVLFDEVRTQRDHETWAAVEPTTTARPNPLILATSTAGDDRSILLREWFDRGLRIIEGAEPAGGFGMTWYAAPDDLAPTDPRAILAANPALAAGRLRMDAIAESYRSMSPAAFRAERLNLWTAGHDEWLPAGVWAATVQAQPERAGPCVIAAEVVPSWRRFTITVAYLTDDGAWVGVAGERDATRDGKATLAPSDLVAELESVRAAWQPAGVAYSKASAAGQHVTAWAAAADVTDLGLGPREIASASELFRSELIGRRLRHPDDALLALQVRRARPSGPLEPGGWYLSTRESPGEIDAVRACAFASWAAIGPAEPERHVQIFL